LVVGDIFAATKILAVDSGKTYPARMPKGPSPNASGAVASTDHVAVEMQEKRKLAETGASVVEMEAAGVAEQAVKRGLPFYCIRVVSDAADDGLPLDFNRFRTQDGRFDRLRIAWAAMHSPLEKLPALWKLRRHCHMASAKLGEFLANCSF
jgi:nucleoside phosphorylase